MESENEVFYDGRVMGSNGIVTKQGLYFISDLAHVMQVLDNITDDNCWKDTTTNQREWFFRYYAAKRDLESLYPFLKRAIEFMDDCCDETSGGIANND